MREHTDSLAAMAQDKDSTYRKCRNLDWGSVASGDLHTRS